ncbi:MAG: urea transporter [Chitinophagales bacterium]|nr:urea transporter [Chitinophagales bacterium]
MRIFFKIILRSIGQIMLQANAITGMLFLAGIFWGSVNMGIATLLSVCIATFTAKLFKWNEDEIQQGLYGFSPALVGVALVLFFKVTWILWLTIIIGAFLSAFIQHIFLIKKIPVYTLPFILVTWWILYLSKYTLLLEPVSSDTLVSSTHFGYATIRGYGQVIFQASIISGVLFFIGVCIHSPLSALYGLAGALLTVFFASYIGSPKDDIDMGLYSYNAVLCAIALTGNKISDGLIILITVLLSVLLVHWMTIYQIPVLTFPFVVATWLGLILKKIFNK